MSAKTSYKLKRLSSGDFSFVVLTLDTIRIDEYLAHIENELKNKKAKGKIVFDLLIMNGLSDRFYSAEFNGKSFILSSFRPLDNGDAEFIKESNKFYSKHFDIVINTNMPKTKKFLIKKEINRA